MARFCEYIVRHATGRLLWLNLAALVLLKLVIPIGGGGVATITEQLGTFETSELVVMTNATRADAGLPALSPNTTLEAAATRKLEDMAARQYFAHQNPDGRQPWDFMIDAGYSYRAAGENLGKGFTEPTALLTAWMDSPSHRANIVNTSYRDIGIAARRIMLNGNSTIVVVQMFGAPKAGAVAVRPAPSQTPVATRVATPAAVTPSRAPAPQRISTERVIAPVQAPTQVTLGTGVAGAEVTNALSGGMALYVSALLFVLSLSAAWVGWHRRLVFGTLAHAFVLAGVMWLPALVISRTGVIF